MLDDLSYLKVDWICAIVVVLQIVFADANDIWLSAFPASAMSRSDAKVTAD